jgi:hypothetical protein
MINISDSQKDSEHDTSFVKLFLYLGCLGEKNALHLHSLSGRNSEMIRSSERGLKKRRQKSSLKDIEKKVRRLKLGSWFYFG